MKILIKEGRVIDPANNIDKIADILISDGIIEKVSENITANDAEVINAKGKIVAPGLVDMHCHLREPGFEYKETIETGTQSAAMGGITSVACMPNTNPVTDNAAVVGFILAQAQKAGNVNVYPIGAISKGLKGQELSEMGELKKAGAVAVSDDGKPVQSAVLMRHAMEYAAMFDLPVISHCEEMSLVDDGYMNEGNMSTYLGLRGITRAAEEVMVSREIILAQTTNTPVHIAHVSTKGSVELVRHAKAQGVRVTCETCPHYFTLTDKAVDGFNTNAKMNPPLREQEDVDAVIAGIADGTIDAIATDHAPHHVDEKNCEFGYAANGIVGFETLLPLTVTYLVKTGKISINEAIKKMSVNPSGILKINKGTIKAGDAADIVIFDTENQYTIDVDKFVSKSKNSPYNGFEVYGKVEYTIVNGKIIVKQGRMSK